MTVTRSQHRQQSGLTAADQRGQRILENAVKTAPIARGTSAAGGQLKRLLRVAGYGSFMNGSSTVGEGTVKAVQAFQRAAGLPASGEVDAPTLKKLECLELHMRRNADSFAHVGQRSDGIESAERRLRALGYQTGEVDGIFDTQDQQAIVEFRRDQGGKMAQAKHLLLTGSAERVLKQEVKKLDHDPFRGRRAATQQHQRLNALTASQVAQSGRDEQPGLSEGDRGRAIINIQAHLRAAGYDPKSTSGRFDERTAAMVRAFQQHAGLSRTGRVDSGTWSALQRSVILGKGGYSPAQAYGEHSGAVKHTEELLNRLGYQRVRADGNFGRVAERAVKDFEKKHDLKVDGRVNERDIERMRKVERANRVDLNTVKGAARFLLQSKNVSFWSGLSSGSDRKNLVRLARGEKAYVPATGGYVMPKRGMMRALAEMAKRGPIMINALTGGSHSPNSNHYSGTAVDLDVSTGNSGMIEKMARRYGGYRNSETDHIHLDF